MGEPNRTYTGIPLMVTGFCPSGVVVVLVAELSCETVTTLLGYSNAAH